MISRPCTIEVARWTWLGMARQGAAGRGVARQALAAIVVAVRW